MTKSQLKSNFIFFICTLIVLNSCTSNQKTEPSPLNISPAGKNSSLPHLSTGPDNTALISWIEQKDSLAIFYTSTATANGWTEPVKIDSSSEWFINWADYPSVTTGSGNTSAAHVLQYSGAGTYNYDILMYTNSGKAWKKFLLNSDGIPAEHGFVSIVPYDTNFFVTWLDGRNTAIPNESKSHDGHHGSMSLRAAIISTSGQKIKEWEIDSRTCDCCQTAAAITRTGPVVIYRDRSDTEIRDISISRFRDGNWTSPEKINDDNWMIHGCPVNGPRALASGNLLAVVWYTEAQNEPAVYFGLSENNGESFGKPVRVDTGKPIGRVDITYLPDDKFLVSWIQDSKIMVRVLGLNGIKSQPKVIAESSDSRSSGFPQMTSTGNLILFAWTDNSAGQVKTSAWNIRDFE